MTDLNHMGQAARAASRQLAVLPTARKNAALLAIADALEAQRRRPCWPRTPRTSRPAAPRD